MTIVKNLLIACFSIITISTSAQTHQTFFLGHSLVNFHVPNMVQKLSTAAAQNFSYDLHIGNGANLLFHWTNPNSPGAQGDLWDTTMDNGGYEHFIFTEAVPLQGHLTWSNTYRIADSFCSHMNLYNPSCKFYVYETWHCTKSGNGSTSGIGGAPCDWDPGSTVQWRTRLTNDLPLWEGIADSVAAKFPGRVFVIPAGQALARLSDSIDAGKVAGLDSIEQLFTDDIHLSNSGNYFIACVMFSVIHGISPANLPNQLTDEWGSLYSSYPTVSQAQKMQQIAFETVCDYSNSGVFCSPLEIEIEGQHVVNSSEAYKELVSIYNLQGSLICTEHFSPIQLKAYLQQLPLGFYFVQQKGAISRHWIGQ
ncbi:MAG: hypothetical protein RL660_482 [Bacteroidota bacterium]|jgi:hypothetical protein